MSALNRLMSSILGRLHTNTRLHGCVAGDASGGGLPRLAPPRWQAVAQVPLPESVRPMFARTPGTFAPPAGAASPTVALPWGSSTDRGGLPPASAVWSRFHDGGSLSSVSRVEAKELTERVAHLERDRAVLVQELQAAQQVRADWESALSAAEAKVLHERSEHASAVALLRNQLAGARAELEAVRGELAQVRHLCYLKSCCAVLAPAPCTCSAAALTRVSLTCRRSALPRRRALRRSRRWGQRRQPSTSAVPQPRRLVPRPTARLEPCVRSAVRPLSRLSLAPTREALTTCPAQQTRHCLLPPQR